MPDLQVSNARRVVFTAMAVVAFWVLAFQAYCVGCEHYWYDVTGTYSFSGLLTAKMTGLLLVVPVGFLSWSAHNSPGSILRDRWIWWVCCVQVSFLTVCFELGSHGAEAGLASYMPDQPRPIVPSMFSLTQAESAEYEVSWRLLLLLLVLTTAFVIYGAWRRASRIK